MKPLAILPNGMSEIIAHNSPYETSTCAICKRFKQELVVWRAFYANDIIISGPTQDSYNNPMLTVIRRMLK